MSLESTGNASPTADAKPAFIQARGIGYRYPGSLDPALGDIEFDINRGSCFGLLGPNGAGKTTLISLLTGALKLQQGDIRVGDYQLSKESGKIKSLSALVPQEYAFYPSLSAMENLRFFAGLYAVNKSDIANRIEYCVKSCGLEKVLHKKAGSYSGGIKRRLNIALGLVNLPQVLYLDEPTVGIDAQSRHFILQTIEELGAGGMTIVYTSHYMEEVEQLCDDIAIIDHGGLVLRDSKQNLLQTAQQLIVTLTDCPGIEQLVKLQQQCSLQSEGRQLRIDMRSQQSLPALIEALNDQNLGIEHIHLGDNRLEDVYLQLTKHELRQ